MFAISHDEAGRGRGRGTGTFYLPGVPSPQKSAGLGGRSYAESWGWSFAVLHPPERDYEGDSLWNYSAFSVTNIKLRESVIPLSGT